MNKALTGFKLTYRGLILNIGELRGLQLAAYLEAQASTGFTQMASAPTLCPSLLGDCTKGRLRTSHCSSQFPEGLQSRNSQAQKDATRGNSHNLQTKFWLDKIEKLFTMRTIQPWNRIPERFGISMPENTQKFLSKKDPEQFGATKSQNKNTHTEWQYIEWHYMYWVNTHTFLLIIKRFGAHYGRESHNQHNSFNLSAPQGKLITHLLKKIQFHRIFSTVHHTERILRFKRETRNSK